VILAISAKQKVKEFLFEENILPKFQRFPKREKKVVVQKQTKKKSVFFYFCEVQRIFFRVVAWNIPGSENNKLQRPPIF